MPSTGSANSSLSSLVQLEQEAVPSVKTIEVALARALARARAGAHSESANGKGVSPVVIVLVPLSCCLPLVLASLSSLSRGGLLSLDSAVPLVACFLVVVLIGLGYHAGDLRTVVQPRDVWRSRRTAGRFGVGTRLLARVILIADNGGSKMAQPCNFPSIWTFQYWLDYDKKHPD